MADKHEHIDLVTLEEVQRLLADTDFASAHEIARSGALGDVAGSVTIRPSRTSAPTQVEAGRQAPLPRRQ